MRAIETPIRPPSSEHQPARSVGYPHWGHRSASGVHGTFCRLRPEYSQVLIHSSRDWGAGREGLSLTLKLAKADRRLVSTDRAHRSVELELAAFVNAVKGTGDRFGTPLSALKDVGLL